MTLYPLLMNPFSPSRKALKNVVMDELTLRVKHVKQDGFAGLKIDSQDLFRGTLLFLHGYGGCKEEMLGISLSVARKGFSVLAVDLPGHGESDHLFSYMSAMDCIDYWWRATGSNISAVIGHSIGARLALLSASPGNVAISPPLGLMFPGGKKEMYRMLRPRRVRESAPFSGLVETLEILGTNLPITAKRNLILFGQYDLAAVKRAVEKAPEGSYRLTEIKYCDHHDILTSRETAGEICSWLEKGPI